MLYSRVYDIAHAVTEVCMAPRRTSQLARGDGSPPRSRGRTAYYIANVQCLAIVPCRNSLSNHGAATVVGVATRGRQKKTWRCTCEQKRAWADDKPGI